MTSDPNAWFLASQALDHHDTVAALIDALTSDSWREISAPRADVAEFLAAELARSGYALVRLTTEQHTPTDMSHRAARRVDLTGFLSRKED